MIFNETVVVLFKHQIILEILSHVASLIIKRGYSILPRALCIDVSQLVIEGSLVMKLTPPHFSGAHKRDTNAQGRASRMDIPRTG